MSFHKLERNDRGDGPFNGRTVFYGAVISSFWGIWECIFFPHRLIGKKSLCHWEEQALKEIF